jgi:phosphoglycolate phosphatase
MIGDRKHDIIGARNTGIDSIGVTYGYGSFEELSHSNPTYIVQEC